jgi:hypothetical protein
MMFAFSLPSPTNTLLTFLFAGATSFSLLPLPSLVNLKSTCVSSSFPLPPSFLAVSSPLTNAFTTLTQLGVIPGAGGTQRLTHAIGKSRAMELVLTGRNFSAQEASDWGLVSRVVDPKSGTVVEEAIKVAGKIASKGRIAVQAGKEGVNSGASAFLPFSFPAFGALTTLFLIAYELSLAQGLHLERRLFHQLFATVRSLFLPLSSPSTRLTLLQLIERPEDRNEGIRGEAEAGVDAHVSRSAVRNEEIACSSSSSLSLRLLTPLRAYSRYWPPLTARWLLMDRK